MPPMQGYEVWMEMVNESGGLLRPTSRDGHQGRPVRPEPRRDGLQRAHRAGQRRSPARNLLLAPKYPGLGRRRAGADGVRRAGGRLARHVQPRLRVPVLRAAGDGAAPGRPLLGVGHGPARGREAGNGRVRGGRRSVRRPGRRGHPGTARGGRRRNGLLGDLPAGDGELRRDRGRHRRGTERRHRAGLRGPTGRCPT